jgi:hypothetical protein
VTNAIRPSTPIIFRWSRRFVQLGARDVGGIIQSAGTLLRSARAMLRQASRIIPPRLRPSVFAVVVDLMLADNTLEREERQFVAHLATVLKVRGPLADDILRVILIKNGA